MHYIVTVINSPVFYLNLLCMHMETHTRQTINVQYVMMEVTAICYRDRSCALFHIGRVAANTQHVK